MSWNLVIAGLVLIVLGLLITWWEHKRRWDRYVRPRK